jgi:ADP-ribose pyrophosphatase YjhB (NUDIX family)
MITLINVLIKKDDQYLFVQEKKPQAFGLWSIPGGRVRSNETIEEAALREGFEETGLLLKLDTEIKVIKIKKADAEIHIYEASIIKGKVKLNPKDHLNISWFTTNQIKKLPLRKKFILDVIKS